jgi:hypothetical protein
MSDAEHRSDRAYPQTMSTAFCIFPRWRPDIITAIINGKNPPQLAAKKLMRLTPQIPVDWTEHGSRLAFNISRRFSCQPFARSGASSVARPPSTDTPHRSEPPKASRDFLGGDGLESALSCLCDIWPRSKRRKKRGFFNKSDLPKLLKQLLYRLLRSWLGRQDSNLG